MVAGRTVHRPQLPGACSGRGHPRRVVLRSLPQDPPVRVADLPPPTPGLFDNSDERMPMRSHYRSPSIVARTNATTPAKITKTPT